MIAVALTTEVASPRRRVWAALASAGAVPRWRPGVEAALAPETPYPVPGRGVRWRARLGGLPLELRETPLEVVPERRLTSRLALGLFRCETAFALRACGRARTRVALRASLAGAVPVVGGALAPVDARRFATELVAETLRALRDYCELAPRDAAPPREAGGARGARGAALPG